MDMEIKWKMQIIQYNLQLKQHKPATQELAI